MELCVTNVSWSFAHFPMNRMGKGVMHGSLKIDAKKYSRVCISPPLDKLNDIYRTLSAPLFLLTKRSMAPRNTSLCWPPLSAKQPSKLKEGTPLMPCSRVWAMCFFSAAISPSLFADVTPGANYVGNNVDFHQLDLCLEWRKRQA